MHHYQHPEKLKEEIDSYYTGDRGPGDLPLTKLEHNVKAIIVPNSIYKNCGECMAWGYKAIAESPLAPVYIILAAGEPGIGQGPYQTPIEKVRVDQELAKVLAQKGTLQIKEIKNTAIDAQLPFLQHAKYLEHEHIKILPLSIDNNIDLQVLAVDLKEALIELKREPVFIVSTNFTQFGPLFKHVPFSMNVEQSIYELDKASINFIKQHNLAGFKQHLMEKMAHIPGAPAIELLLRVMKPVKATVEQYYTSADVLPDKKNIVSYAAVVFDEKQ